MPVRAGAVNPAAPPSPSAAPGACTITAANLLAVIRATNSS